MDRAERRHRQQKKWESKLKKLWNSYSFFGKLWKVKTNRKSFLEMDDAKSWRDLKEDKTSVLYKNTGTICKDSKILGIKEVQKRNYNNKHLSKEEQEEVSETIEQLNNPYYFETICGNCDNFPNNNENHNCPFYDKFINGEFNGDTKWEEIGCKNFDD